VSKLEFIDQKLVELASPQVNNFAVVNSLDGGTISQLVHIAELLADGKPSEPDLTVQNEGSIFILRALTDNGKQWVAEHVPEDAQTWGVVVEHRYIADIVHDGIRNGLEK
jgi:hypothetical protein